MRKIKAVSLIMMALFFIFAVGCKPKPPADPTPVLGEMTDARDNQTYATVTLGDQTWLAQDLNYASDDSKWYDDDPANCEIYGRLYDWEASKTACPAGWHLGSDEEWSTLIKFLDPKANPKPNFLGNPNAVKESIWAGGMLKETGNIRDETGLWNYPNVGATNSSKFSAIPAGVCYSDGSCDVMGRHAIYWTSTENANGKVWFRVLDYGLNEIYRAAEGQWSMERATSLTVRCLKD
jgi:uncharacterized protein (TIGR02145 family)